MWVPDSEQGMESKSVSAVPPQSLLQFLTRVCTPASLKEGL